ANGIRVSAYRAAMIVSGGGIVFFAGFVGWPPVWWAAAALLLVLALVVLRAPAGVGRLDRQRNFYAPLLTWASRPGSAAAIAQVLPNLGYAACAAFDAGRYAISCVSGL